MSPKAIAIRAVSRRFEGPENHKIKPEKKLEKIEKMMHQESLFYILEIIKTELINSYYNHKLLDYFSIKKI